MLKVSSEFNNFQQFYWPKCKNKIRSIKCQCTCITMANLYQSMRLIMDYNWINFGIHVSYHYWDIANFLFLGSILIKSVKCTIAWKKIEQYVFLLLTRYYFQKSITFASNQKLAWIYFLEHQRPYCFVWMWNSAVLIRWRFFVDWSIFMDRRLLEKMYQITLLIKATKFLLPSSEVLISDFPLGHI